METPPVSPSVMRKHIELIASCGFLGAEYMDKQKFIDLISQEFDEVVVNLHKRFLKKYGFPSCGRNRATYIADKYVVKLPVSFDGFADNDWEGSLLHDPDRDLARTRLVYVEGVPVLFMEKVTHCSYDQVQAMGKKAQFMRDISDCGQVGLTRKGKLVCYDYGIR